LFSEGSAAVVPGKTETPRFDPDGNVWSCRDPDEQVRCVEFLTDGAARFYEGGRLVRECRWSREDGAVTADASKWTLSPDKTWIVQEKTRRVWYRSPVPPPPDPRLATILPAAGGRWELDAGDAAYVFQTDGSFVEEGVRGAPKGVWQPWYGRTVCLRHASGRAVLLNVSADGTSLLREDGNLYRKQVERRGGEAAPGSRGPPSAPPAPLPVAAPVLPPRPQTIPHGRSALAGTEWCCRTPAGKTGTLAFRADGSGEYDDGATRSRLKWTASDEREACGEGDQSGMSFTVSPGGCLAFRWKRKTGVAHTLWYPGRNPPPPSPRISERLAAPGVSWYKAEKRSTYTFRPDGTFDVKWPSGKASGSWRPWYGDAVLASSDSGSEPDVFAVPDDGAVLWRSRDSETAWLRKTKDSLASAPPPTAAPAAGEASPARAEFAALEREYAEAFAAAMEKANARDAAALDALKKRAGTSELDALQRIVAAQAAVADGAAILYAPPPKASPVEKELARVKAARDRAIADAARATALRMKPAYAACLRKAVEAEEIDLAKRIKTKLDAMGL
jgi:hypothetical protein